MAVWMGAELAPGVGRASLVEFMGDDVIEEPIVDKELAPLLIVAGPFEADGQKLPVCCRQLNC